MKLQFVSRGAGHILVAMIGILLLPGCSRRMASTLLPNLPPELEILDARADRANASDVRVRWAARDPDGSVARSCWTLSPMRTASAPGEVSATLGQECVLARRMPIRARVAGVAHPEPDLFTVWAVDNRGAQSERATVAMFGNNIAPSVQITCPLPSDLVDTRVGPTVKIFWTGTDPDGAGTQKPVLYRWKLFRDDSPEFPFVLARVFPDSLRRFYAANGWAGWDSLGGESTGVSLPAQSSPVLEIRHAYLFVVTAVDEMGDYDPAFSARKNMLFFTVVDPQLLGPGLSVWNSSFSYTTGDASGSGDPRYAVNVEVPSGEPLALNVASSRMTGSRWVLDPADPASQEVRTDPSDLRHWSPWSTEPRITIDLPENPRIKREQHTLFIEAKGPLNSCVGTPAEEYSTLVPIHVVVVRPTYNHELLIVDDTRREVDRYSASGAVRPYTQFWPAAAELDTFLYARGGVPWRGTLVSPSAVPQPVSRPGLFAGYSFDTVGTRSGLSGTALNPLGPPTGTIPLSLLANYRHVIWITDLPAAQNTASPINLLNPMSALRDMSRPAHVSILATYVAMGGKLWLLGGATAYASLIEFNARASLNNDAIYGTGKTVFSNAAGELVPSRLMYDLAHVRSELVAMSVSTTGTSLVRSLGRFEGNPGPYAMLPASFREKSLALGDSLPPTRANGNQFYNPAFRGVEFLTQPNIILEDASTDPNFPDPQPALDSLFRFTGGTLPQTGYRAESMLNYHGRDNSQFLWTGFDIWSFTRSDCQAFVDGVLQGIWGMPREAVAPAARAGRVASVVRQAPAGSQRTK